MDLNAGQILRFLGCLQSFAQTAGSAIELEVHPTSEGQIDHGAAPFPFVQEHRSRQGAAQAGGRLLATAATQGASTPTVGEGDLENPALSPLHLLRHYVHMTSQMVASGSFLFRSLSPPYPPLTANSLGRITKVILQRMGVPMQVFGPHSTRGAAVKMYKALGLSSEQVCELGQWKNASAFTAHYLRLGAADSAATLLEPLLVHTVSSYDQGDPEWSHSPGTPGGGDPGQWDHEGDLREEDEPSPPSHGNRQRSLQSRAISKKASADDYKTFRFKQPTAGAMTKH